MIVYGCLARLEDATPLSASTDAEGGLVREGKRCVKVLAGRLRGMAARRVCLQADEVTVHCVKDDHTAYMAVCDPTYPHILAFGFLDEVLKEFNLLYTASVVKSVRRPYAFIEFDNFLQKTRQKYNSSRSLASRLNLSEMTTDLNLHPPSYVKMDQLEPQTPPVTSQGGTNALPNGTLANGAIPKDISTVGITLRLRPIPWFGWMAIWVAGPLILLDVYRGAVAISMSSLEDVDGPSPWHGIFFIIEMILQIVQVHMLWRYNKFRKLCTLFCVVFILLLNTWLLDVREGWLCSLYVLVTSTLMAATYRRPFERKLPRFYV